VLYESNVTVSTASGSKLIVASACPLVRAAAVKV
jgi:hypothetical protein